MRVVVSGERPVEGAPLQVDIGGADLLGMCCGHTPVQSLAGADSHAKSHAQS